MSVFTQVSHAELKHFLRQYPLGELLGFQGIGEGVENSNFYVDTADGRWVLTLFERLNHRDLPFFLGLMNHLARRRIPCPRPLPTRQGRTLTRLKGKPAALVQRLTGQSVLFASIKHCAAVGQLLGQLHRAGRSYPLRCRNSRGADWRRVTARKLLPELDADDVVPGPSGIRAQAVARTRGSLDRGKEAALAALEMLKVRKELKNGTP